MTRKIPARIVAADPHIVHSKQYFVHIERPSKVTRSRSTLLLWRIELRYENIPDISPEFEEGRILGPEPSSKGPRSCEKDTIFYFRRELCNAM